MKTLYSMLMQFTNGDTPCRKHLLRNFPAELIDDAINQGYIIEIKKTDLGDPVYTITQKGKDKRDK